MLGQLESANGFLGEDNLAHVVLPGLTGAAFFGIEMILAGLSGEDFAVLRHFQSFRIRFYGFHGLNLCFFYCHRHAFRAFSRWLRNFILLGNEF
jgi:hypothetical protein